MTSKTSSKKTVLITGASTGFGRTFTKHFAARGFNVIATMRDPQQGEDLAGDDVLVTRLDVTDVGSVDDAIAAGIARFGGIDVVINNAGYGLWGVFETTTTAQIAEQFDVNVFGVMNVTRAVLPHLRERKAGVIINISSGAGVFTLPLMSMYSASKFALEGFSEALSYELLAQNIVVKIVEPGGVVSTGFGGRSAHEATQQGSIADYDGFVAQTSTLFDALRADRSNGSEEGVADVVYGAATDGSTQLRYLGTDGIAGLVKLRREAGEATYIETMRKSFTR